MSEIDHIEYIVAIEQSMARSGCALADAIIDAFVSMGADGVFSNTRLVTTAGGIRMQVRITVSPAPESRDDQEGCER